jgi:hypothetical protein
MKQAPTIKVFRDGSGNMHFDLTVGATLVLTPEARRASVLEDLDVRANVVEKLIRMVRAEVMDWKLERTLIIDEVPR